MKHTFLSLCKEYDKIEIPVIQRNYAQGRKSAEKVRSNFLAYIADKLFFDIPIELDFIYGSIRIEQIQLDSSNAQRRTFIPIDGQQRLTTLFLLHWYLTVKDGRLGDFKPHLEKFCYETRPSSHDFCKRLVNEQYSKSCLNHIDEFIREQSWFDNEWLMDGTIAGMLQMLHDISRNKQLNSDKVDIDQLALKNRISFYFVPLEKYGLSDEIYVRMNARGKILTDFENFKSEFYKLLSYHPALEDIKDKMEYEWVNNLWPFVPQGTFVTDECFMSVLSFVTQMLYFKHAQARDSNGYATNFLDLKLIGELYKEKENADFFFFVLDKIPTVSSFKGPIVWEKNNELKDSIANILSTVVKSKSLDVTRTFVLFCTFDYLWVNKTEEGLMDYIRVIRNLIINTPDNSSREWPTIIKSFRSLTNAHNTHKFLTTNPTLSGLRNEQCHEEIFKAKLYLKYPKCKADLYKIEDNYNFKGNITNILATSYVQNESDIAEFDLNSASLDNFSLEQVNKVYVSYKEIASDDFNQVFGNLIDSGLYTHLVSASRLVYNPDYGRCPAIVAMAADYSSQKCNDLELYLISIEKQYVNDLHNSYSDFSLIDDVKVQLRLYYIITRRLMKLAPLDFFKEWNFGWLSKEIGFVSLFKNGIRGDSWWGTGHANPIFQTYNSQFRYNLGLNEAHALDVEIVGKKRPQQAFEKLIKWAQS